MRALLWVSGAILAAVIGYYVFKALGRVEAVNYNNQKVLDTAINTGASSASTVGGKVLRPNFSIETGMGKKKGFF